MSVEAQRAAALDAANQIRIGAREVSAARVLEDMPECIRGAGVFQFLCYLPKTVDNKRGSTDLRNSRKAFQLLNQARVLGHKRLDQLTPAQLERLTRVVRNFEQAKHPAERGLS